MYTRTSFSSFQLKVKIDKITQQNGGLKHYALFMKLEFLLQQHPNTVEKVNIFINTLKFGLHWKG